MGTGVAATLEDMLEPGERVIYQARYSFLNISVQVLFFVAFTAASATVFAAATTILSFELLVAIWLLAISFSLIWTAVKLRKTRIFVTDRRILRVGGFANPDVNEVTIADVESVAFVYLGLGPALGHVSLRLRDGNVVRLSGGPRPQYFCAAIAAQAGASDPMKFGRKPIIVSNLTSIGGFLTGFGLTGLGLEWFLGAYDGAALLIFFLPIFIGAIIVGFVLASLAMLIVARAALSPDEAGQLVCIGLDPHSDDWSQRFSRRSGRICKWALSWLYREPIRCEYIDRRDR